MKQPKGCLRFFLIGLILMTSLSIGGFYVILNRGLYEWPDAENQAVVLKNAQIWDGMRDSAFAGTLVIEGRDISCVGQDCETPAGAKIIDLKGKAVLPGLVDLHTHFYAPSKENEGIGAFGQLPEFLRQRPTVRRNLHRAGITTIRSVGDITENIVKLRSQIDNLTMSGPKVYATGATFTAPGGYPAGTLFKGNQNLIDQATFEVEGKDVARMYVDDLYENGLSGVKIVFNDLMGTVPKMSADLMQAIIERAHERKMWATVHTGTDADVQMAIAAGADCIEHGASDSMGMQSIRLLAEKEVVFVPTLSFFQATEDASLPQRMKNAFLADSLGVILGAGTNTQQNMTFGSSLLQEMKLLTESGIPVGKVLKIASSHGAIALRKEYAFGFLKKGLNANVLVIDGQPWSAIGDIEQAWYLFQDGYMIMQEGKLAAD
ncbi:MAG: amidohydrolase family protein [Bacteroidota bacterium]